MEPSWASIVNKEVDSQFERVSKDVPSVKSVIEVTRKMANEERERETRSHNIIAYRVPEVDAREDELSQINRFA